MRGVVCAVSVGRLRSNPTSNSTLVLDPSDDELPLLDGVGCFAFLSGTGRKGGLDVVWSNWQSVTPFDEEELVSARDLAKSGAETIWMHMKKSVGGMGDRKPLALQIESTESVPMEEEESGSDDDSDDDEMEI